MTENQIITNRAFKAAVVGLNDFVLRDKDAWYSYIINLPAMLQIAYTIIVFDQQVSNGGLHQYFFNPYGQFAYLTLKHLRFLSANKSADVLESALNKVNANDYGIDEFRERVFNRQLEKIVSFDEDLEDELNRLDLKYYSLDEDIEQLLVNYLKRNIINPLQIWL